MQHRTHPQYHQRSPLNKGKSLKKTTDQGQYGNSMSKSRGKARQVVGLMERNILQNLQYYRSLQDAPQRDPPTAQQILTGLFPSEQHLRPKPQLNLKSHRLYQKVRRERNLSPNVFQRLRADEESRSRSKLLSIIARIKEVTPTKKIKRQDFERVSTPKEMKYLDQYLHLCTN